MALHCIWSHLKIHKTHFKYIFSGPKIILRQFTCFVDFTLYILLLSVDITFDLKNFCNKLEYINTGIEYLLLKALLGCLPNPSWLPTEALFTQSEGHPKRWMFWVIGTSRGYPLLIMVQLPKFTYWQGHRLSTASFTHSNVAVGIMGLQGRFLSIASTVSFPLPFPCINQEQLWESLVKMKMEGVSIYNTDLNPLS